MVITTVIQGCGEGDIENEKPSVTNDAQNEVERYPDLAKILNKSGEYSFSYINANGRRIAAFDEDGHGYYFEYSSMGGIERILDDNRMEIWPNNRS